MKTVYNTSPHKTITVNKGGEVFSVQPLKMTNVPDDVAEEMKRDWKDAQVTTVSKEAEEPWELKILPSLPPEMRSKIRFKTPKRLESAAEPDIIEPAVPVDEVEAQRLGKPANKHICPRGCGFESPYLAVTRRHMKSCSPRPASDNS